MSFTGMAAEPIHLAGESSIWGLMWCHHLPSQEVFTLPPHSACTPHGLHHSIWNTFWLTSHSFWGLHSTWTPHGFHMDSTWIPHGLHMDSTWTPYGMVMEYPNSTWNGGMSTWNQHGMHTVHIE